MNKNKIALNRLVFVILFLCSIVSTDIAYSAIIRPLNPVTSDQVFR